MKRRWMATASLWMGVSMPLVPAMVLCAAIGLGARGAESVPAFTGSASYVELGAPDALQIPAGEPFTIEGWVRFSDIGVDRCFYSKRNDRSAGTAQYTYMFGVGADGAAMRAHTGSGGSPANTWREVALSPAIESNRWYHLAFSFDGEALSYYLDGRLQGTQPYSFANDVAHAVVLGGYSDASDMAGCASDMRVWSHARSAGDIRTLMNRRLAGAEGGLLGYWPMNEGAGDNVYDGTANAATGTVVNAQGWEVADDFALHAAPAGFVYGRSFTLADIETGSERFTNSNTVDVAAFLVPEGRDRFQITESDDTGALGDWAPTNGLFTPITFAQPAADTNVTLYAWFTNSAESVALVCALGDIYYTEVEPVPVVRALLTRERLPGTNVVVYVTDLDLGSTGGVANDTEMNVHERAVRAANPGDDLTPDAPVVTLGAEGEYPLLLWIKNEAGNAVASAETCMVTVAASTSGSTNRWTGAGGDARWDNAFNWSAGAPLAAQAVGIASGTPLLTSETAELASFTMTGGTLTFSNWTTRLRATEVAFNGGTLTLPPAFTEAQMSNRVWIVCSNMTLAAAATINVTGLGYARRNGEGTGGGNSGGGHGGFGSCGSVAVDDAWLQRGYPYGDEAEPLAPGSGGMTLAYAGAGGGAVRIQASGAVTIYGEITANGASGSGSHKGAAGGSGGSIFIECATIRGDGTGLLSVKGGNKNCTCHGSGGSGGGGRMAVVYQPAAQALASGPKPPVKMCAAAGTTGGNLYMATCGTVFLPDPQFLSSDMSATHWQKVTLVIPAFTDWPVASLTIAGAFGIRDLETLRVDGDLTLATGGALTLSGETTNSAFPGAGTVLTVGGALTISNGASLVLDSHWTDGTSPYVECGSLNVKVDGSVDAKYRGHGPARGPGAGYNRCGAGYGGAGGPGTGTPGQPYGERHAPVFAGSGGGNSARGGRGGGLARISSRNAMRMDGSILASGSSAPGYYGGGASGGGILLTARSFKGTGALSANGGNGNYSYTSGGGGGRIAVWTPFMPYDQVNALAEQETPPSASEEVVPEQWSGWSGTQTAAKAGTAEDGTIFFGRLISGMLIMIR